MDWIAFRENPWRQMLAVNAAVALAGVIYKISLPPYTAYVHLLVDYRFGFIKRALIGSAVSLFATKVPVWAAFALGGAVLLLTFGLFLLLFRRTFGPIERNLPLFVFLAGSPFFFKNFICTLGHFDIYGCAFALVLLLVPARRIGYVVLASAGSMVLLLIHHIHLLMYLPTIAIIVLLRHYLERGFDPRNTLVAVVAIVSVVSLFLTLQFHGSMPISQDAFTAYLKGRMADQSRADAARWGYIWYQTLPDEIRDTWAMMRSNLLGVPVFAALIALHAPLWKYFADMIRALSKLHRRVIVTAIVLISLTYLIMFAMVFDYSRWISNWAVCMFLLLLATRALPASRDTVLDAPRGRWTPTLGWITSIYPYVGTIRPF
jgi:hypothetical protein